MRVTKKTIFKKYDIEYIGTNGGKILAPWGEYIGLPLKKGNSKTGEKVYTFSTLAGREIYHTKYGEILGTCPLTCPGCYARLGCYNFRTVINSLAVNTILVREYMDFIERAIMAQLETLKKIDEIRIFASGDFYISENESVNRSYVEMWRRIIRRFPNKFFWTYTKCRPFENAFDDLPNANIVKSIINGIGFNFGTVEYLLSVYEKLKSAGKDVYICKCGFDDNQHCHGCHSCSKHAFVLFLEHSTKYNPLDSENYETLKAIVMNQKDENASGNALAA